MFDLAWSEIALIGVVALVVIGPKDLPGAIRGVAQMLGKARRMAGEFQTHVDEMVREAKLDEVKREIDQFRNTVQNEVYKAANVDELKRDIVDPLKDTMRGVQDTLNQAGTATSPPAAPPGPADAPAPAAPAAGEPAIAPAAPAPVATAAPTPEPIPAPEPAPAAALEPAAAAPAPLAPRPEEPPAFLPPGTTRG